MHAPANEFPNLALIRQGIEYRFQIKIGQLVLLMRPLSITEEDRITQDVIDEMKNLPEEKKTSLKQSALLSIKKLETAQTSDVNKKDWKMSQMELSYLTPGELEYIFKNYMAGCDKINPGIETFSRDQVSQWVDALKKSSSDLEMILIESSFHQLAAICRHLLSTSELPADSLPG
jgi:hypothetical protein